MLWSTEYGKTSVVRVENNCSWKLVHVASLYTYISDGQIHNSWQKDLIEKL